MAQTDAYPLNERQLELIFNLPYYAALYAFKDPLIPSEAARRLRVPANVMHYRVKRLYEAGLLQVVDDSSRSRTYRSVAQRFSISPEVLPAVTEAMPAMLDTMLSKLHRHALQRTEAELRELETLAQDKPFTFDLSESLTIEKDNPKGYPSWVAISTIDMNATQYRKILDAVRQVFDEAEADKGENRCTLAFLAFQGQGAM